MAIEYTIEQRANARNSKAAPIGLALLLYASIAIVGLLDSLVSASPMDASFRNTVAVLAALAIPAGIFLIRYKNKPWEQPFRATIDDTGVRVHQPSGVMAHIAWTAVTRVLLETDTPEDRERIQAYATIPLRGTYIPYSEDGLNWRADAGRDDISFVHFQTEGTEQFLLPVPNSEMQNVERAIALQQHITVDYLIPQTPVPVVHKVRNRRIVLYIILVTGFFLFLRSRPNLSRFVPDGTFLVIVALSVLAWLLLSRGIFMIRKKSYRAFGLLYSASTAVQLGVFCVVVGSACILALVYIILLATHIL